MEKRSSSAARLLAVVALVAAFVVLIFVVAAAFKGGSDETRNGTTHRAGRHQPQRKTPATYVIKSGDTLTAISHKTGVGVGQIERLNPEVDPQILIAGETLKLK